MNQDWKYLYKVHKQEAGTIVDAGNILRDKLDLQRIRRPSQYEGTYKHGSH